MQNIDPIRPLHNFLSLFRYPKSPDLACIIPPSYHSPARGVSHIIRYPRKFEHILCTECTPVRQQWAGFCAIMLLGGSHYWPIRSGALSARLWDFIAYAHEWTNLFFPRRRPRATLAKLPNSRDPAITRGNYAVACIFFTYVVWM